MSQRGLKSLLYPLLLWLPVTFAIWYFCGPLIALLVATALDVLLPLLTEGRITKVESVGNMIQAVVVVGAGSYKGLEVPVGQAAELLIQTRPMIYAYGMPVFLALVFAADSHYDVSRNILGFCITLLLVVTAFGAGMDLIRTIFLNFPVEISRTSGVSRGHANLIAIGYQFSALILPMVVPILLGCWLCAAWFRSALIQAK